VADRLTKEQRSYCMSRIRGFDTKVEIKLRTALQKKRLRFKANVQSLPGRPDFVFQRARLIVFVDGNFWHGFRYPQWKGRLSPFWQAKIERNRARDIRNHRRLRRAGWRVIRLWEHQVMRDVDECANRVVREVRRKIDK
jgi:DNA mismatch endonuclease, patch repair protein